MREYDIDIGEEHDMIVDSGDQATHTLMFPNCHEQHEWDEPEPITKSTNEADKLFSEETINKAIVPEWKFWLLPLVKPFTWRQVKWTFTDESGKKYKCKGLLKW